MRTLRFPRSHHHHPAAAGLHEWTSDSPFDADPGTSIRTADSQIVPF